MQHCLNSTKSTSPPPVLKLDIILNMIRRPCGWLRNGTDSAVRKGRSRGHMRRHQNSGRWVWEDRRRRRGGPAEDRGAVLVVAAMEAKRGEEEEGRDQHCPRTEATSGCKKLVAPAVAGSKILPRTEEKMRSCRGSMAPQKEEKEEGSRGFRNRMGGPPLPRWGDRPTQASSPPRRG